MIGAALLGSVISLALMKAWERRPSRSRLRRAQRQLGRLALPVRLPLYLPSASHDEHGRRRDGRDRPPPTSAPGGGAPMLG